MNAYFFSLLALDVARERTREAEANWLIQSNAGAPRQRALRIRRPAAQLLAAVSRGTANAVRRLDARVADDLRSTLALAE